MPLSSASDDGRGAVMPAPATAGDRAISQVTPGPQAMVACGPDGNPLQFLGQLIQKYGDVVRYQTRVGECFLFVRPDHVQAILHNENYRRAALVKMMLGNGLLTSDGPEWRSLRRLMQKDFLPAAIQPFSQIITRETRKTAAVWRESAVSGKTVDITTDMIRLTLRIVLESLFSDDLSEQKSTELCNAFTDTIQALAKISSTIFGMPLNFTPTSSSQFAKNKKIVDDTCLEMITRRRAIPPASRPRDLLSLLIDGDASTGPLNDRQLRDEVVTMIVGGHETTALALAWAFKALVENPEAELPLLAEIEKVLAGRDPSASDVPQLKYTQAVLSESMRLYPPVWYLARVASEAGVIGGHAIPQGACLLVTAWFTHRQAEYWPDPEKFDPNRFLDAALSHRYAYFPFGGGRHQCLGMHLALMESAMVLAQLMQQFRVVSSNHAEVIAEAGITLRQSPALVATLQLRSSSQLQHSEPEVAA